MELSEIKVSAPGRICLFGEHQDYFGLPVIAAAINLRIHITGRARSDLNFEINLPDIKSLERIDLGSEVAYERKRDYLKSAINVLLREGIIFLQGWNCTVQGTIPINSGTSSSSALVVAWIKFLLEVAAAKGKTRPQEIAELALRQRWRNLTNPVEKWITSPQL